MEKIKYWAGEAIYVFLFYIMFVLVPWIIFIPCLVLCDDTALISKIIWIYYVVVNGMFLITVIDEVISIRKQKNYLVLRDDGFSVIDGKYEEVYSYDDVMIATYSPLKWYNLFSFGGKNTREMNIRMKTGEKIRHTIFNFQDKKLAKHITFELV